LGQLIREFYLIDQCPPNQTKFPMKNASIRFYCVQAKASFGKWSFLTLNLQNFVVLNEAVRSEFKGKH
jgi:phage pi2 protein 07